MLYRKPWKLILYSPTDNTTDELYKFTAEGDTTTETPVENAAQ